MNKIDIASLSLNELISVIEQLGQKKFRAAQIYKWIHKMGVTSFDEMTDLPKEFRLQLNDNFVIFSCSIEKKLISCYDSTVKYLFKLHDEEFVESVVMKYKYGYSICVSSQVGCKMGCAFCASTLGGCVRNLSVSEILGQVYAAQKDLNVRISHVVMMGMGEPLDNYDTTVKFINMITNKDGLNISSRNISVSTCGIVPKIYELAELKTGITLSVSLHAPNNIARSALMPVNNKWNIETLMNAVRYYMKMTGRRVSFEYTLVKGKNDSSEDAEQLASLLRNTLCHVNLIPVNSVKETNLKTTSDKDVKRFQNVLISKGINATVRRTLGADINASCGQLRKNHHGI